MNDTDSAIEKVYREMLMARSGRVRFRMGLEMFEMARAMTFAGLAEETASGIRGRAFMRIYGDEFKGKELQGILDRIDAYQSGAR